MTSVQPGRRGALPCVDQPRSMNAARDVTLSRTDVHGAQPYERRSQRRSGWRGARAAGLIRPAIAC